MSKIRVVVAEDETLTRLDIVELLSEKGYEIVGEAKDGIEALELCRNNSPDIVMLDIKMPLMTGLQVAKILKKENFEGCVIIATAFNNKEYIDEATEQYVNGYILKPLSEEIFLSNLNMIYSNFKKLSILRDENKKMKDQLNERKIIEKAKGIIMEKESVSEEKAYQKIRSISMEKRISMFKLSEIIVMTGEIL